MACFLKTLFTAQCPKLPQELVTKYICFLITLASLSVVTQLILLILQATTTFYYGPYYRICESISILTVWVIAWVFNKKHKAYSYILCGSIGIANIIVCFELIIKFNEAEEGLLFFHIFMIISLIMIDFLKYYVIMVLEYICLTIYVYVRVMLLKPNANIYSIYDCVFYGTVSTLIMSALYYIYTSVFNIIKEEKDKAVKILDNWKQVMCISPIGIIICSESSILYKNDIAMSILSSNSVNMNYNSILTFVHDSEKLSENGTSITIKTNSSYIYCDMKNILFEEQNGQIIILNDITSVINGQHQKHEQEMVEMLVATSTHEMRTPLHCIKNTLQMLQEEETQFSDCISRAIIACDMQECYINDMLDYAKYRKNSLTIVKEMVCVNDLLNEVGGYFTYTASETNLYFKIDIPKESLVICADYTRLKQILFNLLSNAFKFTQSGGITLKSTLTDGKVKIAVEDTGVGMKPDDIQHLFMPYGVIESTRKINKSGTGLGLFLCKQLCLLMDTDICVVSQLNTGTSFNMLFNVQPFSIQTPMLKKSQKKLKSVLPAAPQVIQENILGKALIVDDNEFNCTILEKMLKLLSVGSYKARNGQSALDLLRSKSDISIGFVDLNMPMMDGFKLLKLISNLYASRTLFPIFALTGDSSSETRIKCKAAGFLDCLLKPFTKDKLQGILVQNNVIENPCLDNKL